jgi:LuxR family maltose regulon positive regulatory protein
VDGRADASRALRARLVERVRRTPPGGVCLLSAEPGYGRRTLLTESVGDDAVTVTLGPDVADAQELRHLVADHLDPGRTRRDPVEALAASDRGWLVLLDVDPRACPEVLGALADLVRRCPQDRRIALTTRGDLEQVVSTARHEGRLVVLDQGDLALSLEESLALLDQWASALPTEERREVAGLCDGWLAALEAVREHLAARTDRDALTWLRTHGAERLLGRWLSAQEQNVRDMLLETAILDRLTPDLVDAVTQSDVGWTLSTLARPRGAVRVADRRPDRSGVWFERHPLLTSLLRYHAGAGSDAQARHRRAADWFRRHGDLGQELLHLLSAGDADTAVERFHAVESDLLLSGGADVALQWYETLPAPRAAEHLLRVTWSHALAGRVPEARTTLYQLRALLVQGERDSLASPELLELAAEVDVAEAWIAERTGDIAATVAAAGRARAVFGATWSTNSRQIATLLLARGHLLLGDVLEADSLLASVRDNPFTTAALGEGRRADTEAAVAWAQGHVHRARAWASRHERWLRAQDPERLHSRFTPSVTGFLCAAEAGEHESALEGLTALASVVHDLDATTEHVLVLLALSSVHAARWRLAPAMEAAYSARAVVLESSPDGGLLPLVTAAQARVRLMAGDQVRAERLVRELPPGPVRQLLAARLALVRGSVGAETAVREVEPTTVRLEVERAVLSAWAYLGSSRRRGEQELLHAADLAGQHGLQSALVDAPDVLLEFARRTATHYVHDPLVGLVQVAVAARTARPTVAQPRSGASVRSDLVLTRGELELVALLPSRATYDGIAGELGVSINTVKTRMRRLYAKLGVHDRAEAIDRAVEYGLLSAARASRRTTIE